MPVCQVLRILVGPSLTLIPYLECRTRFLVRMMRQDHESTFVSGQGLPEKPRYVPPKGKVDSSGSLNRYPLP